MILCLGSGIDEVIYFARLLNMWIVSAVQLSLDLLIVRLVEKGVGWTSSAASISRYQRTIAPVAKKI